MTAGRVLQRDRALVFGALLVLAALAWAYTIYLGLRSSSMSMSGSMAMPMTVAWSATDMVFMFAMWAVMMFAMMLPSVTPTVMIYERVRLGRCGWGYTTVLIAWAVVGC